MAEYISTCMVVKLGSTAISEQVTQVSLDVKAAEPDIVDITHACDTAHTELAGLPGAVRTRATVTCWDTSDGGHAMLDLNVNDTGTLYIYPEGTGSGNEIVTVAGARFLGSPREFSFNGLSKITGEFLALGEPTYSTV